MSIQVRPHDPTGDDCVTRVLELAFAREARESQLARRLAQHPGFDSELSLVAWSGNDPVGAAVFLPRRVHLLGSSVAAAACAPIGVIPTWQGRGVARALLTEASTRLMQRGIHCALSIGAPEMFERVGFGSAFNLYEQRVPVEVVRPFRAEEGEWSALRGEDLGTLPALHSGSWQQLDGSEERSGSELDWEAQAHDSFALCSRAGNRVRAYVRFRVREDLEITDCSIEDSGAVRSVLGLLARLGEEHAREVVSLRLPPNHPVVRTAFHLGSPIEASDFGGAALLAVFDWQALFDSLSKAILPALLRAERPSLSLEIEGQSYRLAFQRGRVVCVQDETDSEQHVVIPGGWAPGLLSGKRSGAELAFDAGLEGSTTGRLLEGLFPSRSPMWSYGPLYEIADD